MWKRRGWGTRYVPQPRRVLSGTRYVPGSVGYSVVVGANDQAMAAWVSDSSIWVSLVVLRDFSAVTRKALSTVPAMIASR